MNGTFRGVAALAFGAAVAIGCTTLKGDTQAASDDAGVPVDDGATRAGSDDAGLLGDGGSTPAVDAGDASSRADAQADTGSPLAAACLLSFDSDQNKGIETYVTIPDAIDLHPVNLTAEAWVSFAQDSPPALVPLLGKPSGNGTEDSFAIWFQDGQLNAGIDPASQGTWLSFTLKLKAADWHHVALTYDDTSHMQRLFLDGIELTHGAATTPVYDPTHDLMIGADNDTRVVDGFFKGRIADVRLWSVARTAAQIADDVAGCVRADDPTLLLDLPLRDGSGLVVHDRTPHHHDGALAQYTTAGLPTWSCGSAPPPAADAGQCAH